MKSFNLLPILVFCFLILSLALVFTACIDPDRGYIETQREYCDLNNDGKTFTCRHKKQLCLSDDGYSCRVNKKGFYVLTQTAECRVNKEKKTLDCKMVDAVCYSYDGYSCGRRIKCKHAEIREALETCGYTERGK